MDIIYYYHIPKCGGTTISKRMQHLAAETDGEFHDFNHHPIKNFSAWNKFKNDVKFSRFLKSINKGTNDFKFIHHHHGFYGLSEIYRSIKKEKEKARAMGNNFFLFTCIRDPMSLQISRINFLRNSCGMPNITFNEALTNPNHVDVMYKYLLHNHPKRRRNLALEKENFLKVLGIVDRVYLLEELNELFDTLSNLTGQPLPPSEKKLNRGTHSLLPDDSQRKQIEQANSLDYFFYNTVSEKQTAP